MYEPDMTRKFKAKLSKKAFGFVGEVKVNATVGNHTILSVTLFRRYLSNNS